MAKKRATFYQEVPQNISTKAAKILAVDDEEFNLDIISKHLAINKALDHHLF